jgi:Domain of unknown function (DUF4160)
MPTVAIVEGVKIQLHFDDHPPPHFHAVLAEHRVKIDIDTLQVIAGSLPRTKLEQVLAWAEARRDRLQSVWFDCAAGQSPEKIR